MEWDEKLEKLWLNDLPDANRKAAAGIEPRYNWPCYFLWRSLVLNSNGKVARCLLYQNVAQYANLNERSVLDAYNDPSVQRARQLFRRGPVEEGEFPSPCKNCSYYERHHGGEYLGKREAVRASLPVLAGAGVDLDMATAIPNTLAKS